MTQQEREDYLARSALFNGGSIGSLPTFIDNGTVWINRNTRQGPKREFNLPQQEAMLFKMGLKYPGEIIIKSC